MQKPAASPILLAIAAAACYGLSAPLSKLLLAHLPPAWLASLLYLGAGVSMLPLLLWEAARAKSRGEQRPEARIARRDLPYVVGMIVLDVAAPLLLLFGLASTSPASASLLNNFEIVATTLVAWMAFREPIGRRIWLAIALITVASALLSLQDGGGLAFSTGSLLVLLACVCWGVENNCTRMLSLKNPLEIVAIKGFGSGVGSAVIALLTGERIGRWAAAQDAARLVDATTVLDGARMSAATAVLLAMLLGAFAYGLSIYLYILAQRGLGAARTSAFYAFAPFIGVGFSLLIFGQQASATFFAALALMSLGAYLAAFEGHSHAHIHEAITHEHRHTHADAHHAHDEARGPHSHLHTHAPIAHSHTHAPDAHHGHGHP